MRSLGVVALVFALVLSSCGGGGKPAEPKYSAPRAPKPAKSGAPWARPDDTLALAKKAGLGIDRHEFFTFHIHVHLDVFVNGKRMPAPSGLGINIKDPGVQSGPGPGGTGYGGISQCAKPCIAWLHTHNFDGVIHVEAPKKTTLRLGQFFDEWGVKLNKSCVGGYCAPDAKFAIFIDGTRYTGNPDNIPFVDQQEIAIVIGSPPEEIPAQYFAKS